MSDVILLTIPSAQKASGFSRTRIYDLLGTKQLHAVRIGRRTMVRASSLEKFIASLPEITSIKPAKAKPN